MTLRLPKALHTALQATAASEHRSVHAQTLHVLEQFCGSFPVVNANNDPATGEQARQTAQTILAAFIDWDRANGGQLTRRTIGQLAKSIGSLLEQGVSDRQIRRGLAEWRAKGLHPAALDSFVNAAMAGTAQPARRLSTGERALQEAEQLKAELRGTVPQPPWELP